MWKNGANTAMGIKTWGNSNSDVNSNVSIRLDSGCDPFPGSNSGKITYNINGLDKHVMNYHFHYHHHLKFFCFKRNRNRKSFFI